MVVESILKLMNRLGEKFQCGTYGRVENMTKEELLNAMGMFITWRQWPTALSNANA